MKPPIFEYVAARSVDEALDQLGRAPYEAKVLAGGQSLTPMLNFRLARPALLVDLNRIPGLGEIAKEDSGLRLGALVRHRAVETSVAVREHLPMLAAAAEHVGHLAIRNRGTFGGSVAHADPAAEWPLMARLLDAVIVVRSPDGERTIPAADFFVSILTTALREDEILTEVRLPHPPAGTGWGFLEFSRQPGDFALAAVGALARVENGVCTEARIAMAGVGATPLRASRAEASLVGKAPDPELLDRAGVLASEQSDPSNDLHGSADYRRHLASVLTARALRAAVARAA